MSVNLYTAVFSETSKRSNQHALAIGKEGNKRKSERETVGKK